MKKHTILLMVSLLTLISAGCQNAKQDIEIVDGVKHIHNYAPVWGNTPKVKLEFVRVIGDTGSTDNNLIMYKIKDVVVDKEDNIYILDRASHRVQKFSEDGKYKKTIGRHGQGPGEFMLCTCMDIYHDTLFVYDAVNRKIHQYSLEGDLLGFIPGTDLHGQLTYYIDHFSSGGFISNSRYDYLKVAPFALVELFSAGGEIQNRLGAVLDWKDLNINRVLNTGDAVLGKDDYIYFAHGQLNRFEKYNLNGKRIFTADRPLNFEVKDKQGYRSTEGHRKIDLEPDLSIVSRDIEIDGLDRSWVLTPNRDFVPIRYDFRDEFNDTVYLDFHIFTSDGEFLGVIPFPRTGHQYKVRIFGSRLFFFDPYSGVAVYEYKIVG